MSFKVEFAYVHDVFVVCYPTVEEANPEKLSLYHVHDTTHWNSSE